MRDRNHQPHEDGFVRGVTPDPRSPRQIGAEFQRLVVGGVELRPAGIARHDPDILLGPGYRPRYRIDLFDAVFYLTDPVFDEGLGFFIAYVGLVDRDGTPRRLYPRLFYKDSSLVWRVASHFVHTAEEYWIGKGDVRVVSGPDGEVMESAEETTNLPFEIQAALDELRGRKKPRRDDLAVERVLREGSAHRIEPYADFTSPRKRAAERGRIHGGRPVARFTRQNDPTSLRFARGYAPDFEHGVIEESRSASKFFGGTLRKVRVASENLRIQYLFIASPTHAWVNPPQAMTTELSTYGVRVDDVVVDERLCVPSYEYHFEDDGVDPPELHSQIPDGFAGRSAPDGPFPCRRLPVGGRASGDPAVPCRGARATSSPPAVGPALTPRQEEPAMTHVRCPMCDLASGDDASLWSVKRPEVFATDHWRCVLNGRDQRYPGRCIVVARRHVASVPELDEEEWSELRDVMRRVESAGRRAFGADVANWGCLMNHAFQEDEARPHVHWHYRPRFRAPVEVAGLRFEDDAFGRHYEREYRVLDDEALEQIVERLRSSVRPDG